MSTTIRDVLVKITTDNSGLSQGLDAAKGSLKAFSVAAAAAIGAATGAMVAFTKSGLDFVDSQAKAARSMDATINGFRAIQLAGNEAGISTEAMTASMQTMGRTLADAATSGGPAADMLKAIGLSAQDLSKMDADERLATIADRAKQLGLSSGETSRMLQVLGVRSREMTLLVAGGGDAIRAARDSVRDFGLEVSEEMAAKIEAANDAVGRMTMVFEGLKVKLAAEIAPILLTVAENFNALAQSDAVQSAIERLVSAFGALANVVLTGNFIPNTISLLTTLISVTASAAQGFVWLSENAVMATGAIGALGVAIAVLGGPLTVAFKLAGAAAGAYLLMGQNSKVAEDGAYNVAAAEAALIGELNVFSQSASPAARNESRQRVISLKEQATAALATAEAELALAAAMQQKRLTEAPDWIKDANEAGVLNIPEYDAAISKVGELKGQIKEMTSALKDLDASGGSGGGVAATPLPIVPDYTGAGLGLPQTGSGTGAAGGGADGDGLTTRLDALKQELATERELLETWYVERQTLLDEALAAREITEEEYRLQRERLEQEHADRMKAIDKTSVDTKLGIMKSVFGGLASLMETGNKKLFAIGKAASIASAVIDGYEAAVSSYKHGAKIGGPALGAVYAGVSLARTAAMIAKISSQSYGGGASGGGGAGGGSGAGASTQAQAPQPPTQNFVIDAPGMDLSTLVESLNRATDAGYRIRVNAA